LPQIAEAIYILSGEEPLDVYDDESETVRKIFNKAQELNSNINKGVRPYISVFNKKIRDNLLVDALGYYREAKNMAYRLGLKTIDEIDLKTDDAVLLVDGLFDREDPDAPREIEKIDVYLGICLTGDQDLVCMFESYILFSLNLGANSCTVLPHSRPETSGKPRKFPVGEGERMIYKTGLMR
jgi:hypothetical protein